MLRVVSAHAYDIAADKYFLGDWGDIRSRLADEGVNFDFDYVGELAHNASGGTEQLTRYSDQWMFGNTLDLSKLMGWKGGTLQTTITDRNGRNLGADANIGNNMLLQEVYGRSQTWHLTQFWLNQTLADGSLQIKAGRMTMGEDFANFSCDFQNLTFCGSQPGNIVSGYWVNWPTSQWATRLKYQTSQQSYIQIGAYQVNPRYLDDAYTRHHGLSLDNPSGTTGTMIPLEAAWLPTLDGRPGSYKVGIWYNTSDGNDLYDDVNRNPRGVTGMDPLRRDGQFGAYVNFQQQMSGAPGERGATTFLNISQADRNTARVDGQISMGAQYLGPFDRSRDAIGAAIGATHNNARYASFVRQNNLRTGQRVVAGSGYEYVTEMYYSWSPAPSIYLRPNLQYILHPGGSDQNKNAFVIGLKSGLTF
ncbi:carbohydrate porin [Scleromatobacter humisilvae]|uniref:Carbohydrate porin n=1 Tax=Scleromatobacter humisilvae TaxID=2897159 RepID=A0A9X2C317_9BURK|nr:carbohydrate porin [Scleromatobacter humisilvae]MCK9689461.1 carbohydrate porin [Scleromatobacter humisilvae]